MNERDKKTGRFIRNKNEWVFKDGIAYCYLNHELLFYTDLDKYEELSQRSFTKLADGYSATRINGECVLVHRLLTGAKKGDIVDHINRHKQDNRLENLRITNKSMNAFNSKLRVNNTSGRTGVWFRKDTNKWCSEIKQNGKKISLGNYVCKADAIKAREKAEVKYYGDKLQS